MSAASDGDRGVFRSVAQRTVHQGAVFRVDVETFESPTGERFDRDLVRHSGAVAVVALGESPDGMLEVVLVRQFRPALGAELLEIPAGLLDVAGESLRDAAARELAEEAGLRGDDWVTLTTFVTAPGMTDERVTVFLARRLSEVAAHAQGPEEQHMEVLRVPYTDALAMVRLGEITDAKTVIGLLLAQQHVGTAATT